MFLVWDMSGEGYISMGYVLVWVNFVRDMSGEGYVSEGCVG